MLRAPPFVPMPSRWDRAKSFIWSARETSLPIPNARRPVRSGVRHVRSSRCKPQTERITSRRSMPRSPKRTSRVRRSTRTRAASTHGKPSPSRTAPRARCPRQTSQRSTPRVPRCVRTFAGRWFVVVAGRRAGNRRPVPGSCGRASMSAKSYLPRRGVGAPRWSAAEGRADPFEPSKDAPRLPRLAPKRASTPGLQGSDLKNCHDASAPEDQTQCPRSLISHHTTGVARGHPR